MTTRVGLAVRVKNSRLRGGDETGATRELLEVSGRIVGRFWTTTLMGSRCCDRFPGWLESEPGENFLTRLQTYLGRESLGTADKYKTATRIWPCSDQAYYCAKNKDKSRNSEMATGLRAEENREKCSLPADLGGSGRIASTAESSGKQGTKTVDGDTDSDVPLCMLQHIEEKSRERTHCQMKVDQGRLFTEGGGRGSLKTAHSDVPFCILQHAVLDEQPDESEFIHDCLSEEKLKKHWQVIPIQLYKPNPMARTASFVCPKAAEEQVKKKTKQLLSVTTRRARH